MWPVLAESAHRHGHLARSVPRCLAGFPERHARCSRCPYRGKPIPTQSIPSGSAAGWTAKPILFRHTCGHQPKCPPPLGRAGAGPGGCPAVTIGAGRSAVKTLLVGSREQRRLKSLRKDYGSEAEGRPGRSLRHPMPPGSPKPPGQSDPQVSGVSRKGSPGFPSRILTC